MPSESKWGGGRGERGGGRLALCGPTDKIDKIWTLTWDNVESAEEVFERHWKSHIPRLGDAGHVPREKRMSQIEGWLAAWVGRASERESAALSLWLSAGRSIDWPIRHQLMPHSQNSSRDKVILPRQRSHCSRICTPNHALGFCCPWVEMRWNRSNQHPFAGSVVCVKLFAIQSKMDSSKSVCDSW